MSDERERAAAVMGARMLTEPGVEAAMEGVHFSDLLAAIETADRELHAGQTPIYAVNAATAQVFPHVAVSSTDAAARAAVQPYMVATLNGLLAANRVQRIGPAGILPINVGSAEDYSPLAKLKRERVARRG